MIYQIYSEGYLATGMEGIPAGAYYHGEAEGETFKEACIKFFSDPKNDTGRNFDSERMSYWACRLYDNLKDAQKSYG